MTVTKRAGNDTIHSFWLSRGPLRRIFTGNPLVLWVMSLWFKRGRVWATQHLAPSPCVYVHFLEQLWQEPISPHFTIVNWLLPKLLQKVHIREQGEDRWWGWSSQTRPIPRSPDVDKNMNVTRKCQIWFYSYWDIITLTNDNHDVSPNRLGWQPSWPKN